MRETKEPLKMNTHADGTRHAYDFVAKNRAKKHTCRLDDALIMLLAAKQGLKKQNSLP